MLQISDCVKRIGISTAIVWSPDTDVFILSAHLSCKFGIDIWLKTGNKTNKGFIPVHSISQSTGHEISSCLIPFQELTGCNSTSLKGIGKKKAFKVLKRKLKDISKLKELGNKLKLPNEHIRTCESFIYQLYESDSKNNDTDTLRNKTFCSPKQNHLLPPCKNHSSIIFNVATIKHMSRKCSDPYATSTKSCKLWLDKGRRGRR